jgi:multiple sugar transport system permease protein
MIPHPNCERHRSNTPVYLHRPSPRFLQNLFLFSFVLACVAIIAACSPTQTQTTIEIWEFPRWRETPDSVDRFYWIKGQIAEFDRLHPQVSVKLTELTWERGADKKRIAIAAGVGPDIITGTLPVQLIERGLVEPIDDHLTPEEREDFFDPALDAFSYEGKTYGWPWYLTGSVMFLNLDLFETAGVKPPGADWTYQEFLDAARQLSRDSDSDGESDTHGFGFLIRPGDTSAWPFIFPDDAGSLAENPTELPVLNTTGRAGLGRLHRLIHEEEVAPVQSAAWDTIALWQSFADRRNIAMAPWGIWAIPKLQSIEGFDFDVLPYPRLRRDDSTTIPMRAFTGTSGFVVLRQSDAQKRALCMELSRFLVRPEQQVQLARYGVFPSRASAGDIYASDRLMTQAQKVVAAGQTVPQHSQWAKIDERLQKEFQLALMNEKTIDSAITEAAAHASAVLKKQSGDRLSPAGESRQDFSLVAVISICILAASTVIILSIARRKRAEWTGAFAFLFPALIVFAVFMLFPLCWVFALSFQEYSLAGAGSKWVGFENLQSVIGEKVFMRASLNTLVYAVVVVPMNTLSALLVASLIYPLSNRARSFFRGAYYLPGVASIVVITMVWRWMFNESFGLLNAVLGFMGLPGLRWLTGPDIALWSVILTAVARPPGGPILIYLAALDAIPTSLYDAGKIDGAGAFRRWWHITVPLLRPTTLFLALTITIASFQVFAQVLILTGGGPGYATEVVVHRIYTAAIRDFDFGIASAMSLILFLVIMIVSLVQYRFFRSEIEY